MGSDGEPIADAIVLVTNVETGERATTLRTNSYGEFAAELSESHIALSVATGTGYAFAPAVQLPARDLRISLNSQCEVLDGHVHAFPLESLRGRALHIARISEDVGDEFVTAPAESGAFRVCVPVGEYYIETPPEFEARTVLTSAPGQVSFRVQAKVSVRELAPTLSGARLSIEELCALGGSARVIGLGETNHGTSEFLHERAKLAGCLESHGFNLILLEAGFAETLELDRFVRGENVDLRAAVVALGYWMWDTEEFIEVLESLRRHNASRVASAQVRIAGIDIQTTEASVRYVVQALRRGEGVRTEATDGELSLLDALSGDAGARWREYREPERAAVLRLLSRVEGLREVGVIESEANVAAISARAVRHRLAMVDAPHYFARQRARDGGMADMAMALLDVMPSAKATIWAHLGHTGREWHLGIPTLGKHLQESLGGSYRSIALLGNRGVLRAWDSRQEEGVVPHRVDDAPGFALEGALANSAEGEAVSYWWFKRDESRAAAWLSGLRFIRFVGAVFFEGDNFHLFDVAQIDGAVLVDEMSPTTPTATGARRAKPAGT